MYLHLFDFLYYNSRLYFILMAHHNKLLRLLLNQMNFVEHFLSGTTKNIDICLNFMFVYVMITMKNIIQKFN